jgi:sugar phosphate isomerase/epimerase
MKEKEDGTMSVSRRSFIKAAGATGAAAALGSLASTARAAGGDDLRIGMTDWNLGKTADIGAIALAREIGLDGVEVSLATEKETVHLRCPEMQAKYRKAAYDNGIMIPSLCLGHLSSIPLKSEPKSALWLSDAIDAISSLGGRVILVPFFGKGELKMDEKEGIDRVVDVLKELGPKASDAGVVLALENSLSARDNLTIIERVAQPSVKVYYDYKNSVNRGYDPLKEIPMLKGAIGQVHIKNGRKMLSERDNIDIPACGEALRKIGYKGWLVLETSSPNDLVKDTRTNIEYVRKYFQQA